jgi:acyl carrier protein
VPDPSALDMDMDSLSARIRAAVTIDHEVEVHEVLVVPPSEVSKTVSGKVQRGQCRTRYLAGELTALATSIAETPARPAAPATPLHGMLRALDPGTRPTVVAAELRSRLGDLLGLPAARVRSDVPLAGLGLESLRAMELRAGLERDFGVPVPMGTFLRGSVDQLADVIAREVEGP